MNTNNIEFYREINKNNNKFISSNMQLICVTENKSKVPFLVKISSFSGAKIML